MRTTLLDDEIIRPPGQCLWYRGTTTTSTAERPATGSQLINITCNQVEIINWTELHDWCALIVSTTTLRPCSVICTGCRFRSASFVWLCLPSVPIWSGTVIYVSWSSPRRGCWLPSETSIHIDGSATRSTHETRQLVTELSQLPLHALGTIYHPVSLVHWV